MDSILAPSSDGSFHSIFGKQNRGLFLQRLQEERFVFRHAASGLSLFYFLGPEPSAQLILCLLSEHYDFQRDSTWVLKSQGELHQHLTGLGLSRVWVHRAWHYRWASKEDTELSSVSP